MLGGMATGITFIGHPPQHLQITNINKYDINDKT
jgi:hypothetical protein